MSKSVEEISVRRVRYSTDLPVHEVLRRLDAAVNRKKGEGRITNIIRSSRTPRELELRLKEVTGENFGFFLETQHSNWLRMYLESSNIPELRVYTIGNPLIAQGIMRHEPLAGMYVPLRLMIMGKSADPNRGTIVVYDLPSSLIAGHDRGALRHAAEGLDRMLEELAQKITGAA
ncbi:hypothetical protein K488DRAFT_45618 [Vararia minispora EC-137]|uniref:Uncharacterized protein n=1 Tax=Vararia minispora EC-137 TaxID=1314806 RepID=A0ACB8QR85_9AGAM|nr:hypothetical protein K488DRAFT_45618 [Vararia minispora EC-137]